jgi:hypothetical protein
MRTRLGRLTRALGPVGVSTGLALAAFCGHFARNPGLCSPAAV